MPLATLVFLALTTYTEAQIGGCTPFNVAVMQSCVPKPQESSTASSRVFLFENKCNGDVKVIASLNQDGRKTDVSLVVPGKSTTQYECADCAGQLSWVVDCN